MDKFDLTPKQWEEKITARLKEAEKSLGSGTAVLIPYEQVRAEIMEYIHS